MPHASRTPLLLIVALTLGGCAARGPARQRVAEIARADALVHDGCYRCLEEALALYERGTAGGRRTSAAALKGAFGAALLLTVRAKELGLPSEVAMERARAFARRLDTATSSAVGVAALLPAAEHVAGDLSGLDPEERHRRTRLPGAGADSDLPQRTALDPLVDTNLVAAYLALAMDCEAGAKRPLDATAALGRHGGPPLMQYRAAICQLPGARPLETIRQQDSRWVDTLYFEGRRQVQSSAGDPERGVALLTRAREAFPASHATSLALARGQRAIGDYAAALASVDVVLADLPTHRDALLARVENLSALQRHEEAVTAASRMIELGTWHVGDAYYWRAWNTFYRRDLDGAWADVERASTLQSNASVLTLAGFIAHARKDLDAAIDRFDRAFAMDQKNCIAAFSGGMVEVERQRWADASTSFSRSMGCYTSEAAAARAELVRLEASAHSPERKARLAAMERKRAEAAEHLAAQSAFNAAQGYVRLGHKEPALTHMDVAAAHALLRDKAASLRALIEKMR